MMMLDELNSWWNKLALLYRRLIIIGLSGILIVAGGVVGYRWYVRNREQQAQKIFADCMSVYKQASSIGFAQDANALKQQQDLWEEAEIAFRSGYEQYGSSYLAPFFLAFQADALLHQEKNDQARDMWQQARNKLSTSSPFYFLYSTKYALMLMDQDDMREQGVQELDQLAHNQNNQLRDMALYQLGAYYWSVNEVKKARQVWQELANEFKVEGPGSSPWVSLVQSKLE